jgi:hypothetical protein
MLGCKARRHKENGFVGAALQCSAAKLEGTKKEVTQQTGKPLCAYTCPEKFFPAGQNFSG